MVYLESKKQIEHICNIEVSGFTMHPPMDEKPLSATLDNRHTLRSHWNSATFIYTFITASAHWQKFASGTLDKTWKKVNVSLTIKYLNKRDHNNQSGVESRLKQAALTLFHCLLNRLFRRRSKKTSKLRVTGLCMVPAQMAKTRKMFPFEDLIMSKQLDQVIQWLPYMYHFLNVYNHLSSWEFRTYFVLEVLIGVFRQADYKTKRRHVTFT